MDMALVQEKQKALCRLILQHHAEAANNKANVAAISEILDNAKKDKLTAQMKKKLQNLYKTAIQNACNEADILYKALDNIKVTQTALNEMRMAAKNSSLIMEFTSKTDIMDIMIHRGNTLPLWVRSVHENPPPLCGAVPAENNYIAKAGDMVAAKVKIDEEDVWMLAEVIKYDAASKKYEVDDIYEEKQSHIVSRGKVIPLPLSRPNPETHPQALFPEGALVLALFPRTSCFYKALVKKPPAALHDDYELLFENSNHDEGYCLPHNVCQLYVICCKEG